MKRKTRNLLIIFLILFLAFLVFAFASPKMGQITEKVEGKEPDWKLLSEREKGDFYLLLYQDSKREDRFIVLEYKKIPFFNRYRQSRQREIPSAALENHSFRAKTSHGLTDLSYEVNLSNHRILLYQEETWPEFYVYLALLLISAILYYFERKKEKAYKKS